MVPKDLRANFPLGLPASAKKAKTCEEVLIAPRLLLYPPLSLRPHPPMRTSFCAQKRNRGNESRADLRTLCVYVGSNVLFKQREGKKQKPNRNFVSSARISLPSIPSYCVRRRFVLVPGLSPNRSKLTETFSSLFSFLFFLSERKRGRRKEVAAAAAAKTETFFFLMVGGSSKTDASLTRRHKCLMQSFGVTAFHSILHWIHRDQNHPRVHDFFWTVSNAPAFCTFSSWCSRRSCE